MSKIKKITVVTQAGVGIYEIDTKIKEIKEEQLTIDGDPYIFYCGYNEDNRLLFSIRATVSCVIEYLE